ncbi:MAG TPA: SdiA-regulated domain-containing protein [Gemmatimonadales bacterium]|nr:SdiA-regulated domain-containing protein [Gemmatimonadales bacterium]
MTLWFLCLLLQAAPASRLAALELTTPARRLELPRALQEVSGLVRLPEGVLLAHGDEEAVWMAVDVRTGAAVPHLALGAPARGDFEATASAEGRLWLLASDGTMLDAPATATGRVARPGVHAGSSDCELESLAWLPERGEFLAACKTGARRGWLAFRVRRPSDRTWRESPLAVSHDAIRDAGGPDGFSTSDMLFDAHTGHLLLLAGPERALLEITPTGTVVAARRLTRKLHPQPEGLALLPDGSLAIADEARGGGRLTLYAPAPK